MSSLMFLFGKMGRVEFKYGHQTAPIIAHIEKRRDKERENQKIVPLLTMGSRQRRNVRKVPLGSSSKFNFQFLYLDVCLLSSPLNGPLKEKFSRLFGYTKNSIKPNWI